MTIDHRICMGCSYAKFDGKMENLKECKRNSEDKRNFDIMDCPDYRRKGYDSELSP